MALCSGPCSVPRITTMSIQRGDCKKRLKIPIQEPKSPVGLASCGEKDQHAETFVVETSASVVLGSFFFFLGVGGIGTKEWHLRNGSCDRRPEKTQKTRRGERRGEKDGEEH